MYRKFYSYNDMPVIKKTDIPVKTEHKKPISGGGGNFLGNLENDDIILIIVFIMLLTNNCDDKLLLIALALVFMDVI